MPDDVAITWFIVVGLLFIGLALSGTVLKPLPLTTAMIYLAIGIGLGPAGIGLAQLNPIGEAALLERITELAVVISLFTAGLKLRAPLDSERWRSPVRLAFLSMAITVALVAAVGVVGLGLPLGAAVLLGAVLAPTDPVLASDVQVEHALDRDRFRFSLTGEAGLNDGAAFPFVMLGLGLLRLHELGAYGWRWLVIDVVWATAGGLGTGWLLGSCLGRLVLYLRRTHREAVGLDDFLVLGLIAIAYGAALLIHTYGFLAVFAAGLALRGIERESSGEQPVAAVRDAAATGKAEEIATDPETAPAYLAQAALGFNEQLERIAEVGVVLLLGVMVLPRALPIEALWFAALLFTVIRPASVWLGLLGSTESRLRRRLIGWFGIRGIGSLYYLAFAITHGLPAPLADRLTTLTLTAVTISIVVHGISVTPLMKLYGRRPRGGAPVVGP